jgi:hypothetical protein
VDSQADDAREANHLPLEYSHFDDDISQTIAKRELMKKTADRHG